MGVNVNQIVTDRIIEQLEKGTVPWRKPWGGMGVKYKVVEGKRVVDLTRAVYNGKTKIPYHGINNMLLPEVGPYMSFKQITDMGGKIKRGEKGNVVVFWKMLPTKETKADGTETTKVIPMLRYYNVWHYNQTEGIPREKVYAAVGSDKEIEVVPETENKPNLAPCDQAEQIINGYVTRETGLRFTPQLSDQAYYAPGADCVVVPMMSQYKRVEEYYSTTFHELTHSTGHKDRLDRFSKETPLRFGNEEYSKEELVAEIGAASLVNYCGIESENSFTNSAAYIAGWLRKLKDDNRLIVSAASRAEKAVNYILNGKETVEE